MWDLVLMKMEDFDFWTRVLVSCIVWYTLACMIARCECRSNRSTLWSSKAAPWLALLFVAPLSGIGAYLWWDDVLLAIVLGFTNLIVPLLFLLILAGMETMVSNRETTITAS